MTEINTQKENRVGFNEEEFLKKVEKAAGKGARKAGLTGNLISIIPTVALIGLIAFLVVPKINSIGEKFSNVFKVDAPVENHDLTLDNKSFLGYTAADFEEAVLGDSEKMQKVQVYEQEVSDTTTMIETGLFNLGIFTKSQIVTYSGSVTYTVDLSNLSKSDIVFDEEGKTITLKIPHVEQGEIVIPRERIKFSDPEKGLLAIGELKMAPEKMNDVEIAAHKKIQDKLDEENVIETADKLAKLVVLEMYSPIIKGVAKDYSLEVEFK